MRAGVIAGLVAAGLALGACGSSDDDGGSTTAAAGGSTQAASGDGGGGGGGEAIKTAVLLNGKADDKTWNTSMTDSIERVGDEAGLDVVNMIENVSPADGARATREVIEQGGAQLVILHASALDQAMKEVAAEHPEVCFIQAFGQGEPEPNMTFYADDATGVNYLAGMAAGAVSESGVVGTVGGVDLDEIVAGARAFENGIRAVRPDARHLLTWVGDFEDPLKGKEAGFAQMQQGADVLFALGDGTGLGTVDAAKERRAKGIIGAWFDQNELAPDQMVTGFVTDWAPIVRDVADKFRAEGSENCGMGAYVADLRNRGMLLAPFHSFEDRIPADVKRRIEQAREAIVAGELDPVTGEPARS
jgi:basic membrane protein A